MQQPDREMSQGVGCAQAGPLVVLHRCDFGRLQDIAQWPAMRVETARQLYHGVFPNLRAERWRLALAEQTQIEPGSQTDAQLAIVAPGKRAKV